MNLNNSPIFCFILVLAMLRPGYCSKCTLLLSDRAHHLPTTELLDEIVYQLAVRNLENSYSIHLSERCSKIFPIFRLRSKLNVRQKVLPPNIY